MNTQYQKEDSGSLMCTRNFSKNQNLPKQVLENLTEHQFRDILKAPENRP